MRRISPLGGGGGNELVMLRSMPSPVRQMITSNTSPTAIQITVPNTVVSFFD
jgi:hypothetical protein